jgi:hypothetical protein
LPAENFYRYHIMLRTQAMSALSRELAKIVQSLALPEDVTLAVDIAPASLSGKCGRSGDNTVGIGTLILNLDASLPGNLGDLFCRATAYGSPA